MKIALLTSESSEIDPGPQVEKLLKDTIVNIEVYRKVAYNNLDLVRALHNAENFDLVCLMYYYEHDLPDLEVLFGKIVEMELSGKRAMKFIERGTEFDETEEAEKIANSIFKKILGKVPEKH